MRSSHGYPLNAFVTSRSTDELGLVDDADVGHDIGDLVAGSLMAVIVAAFDADSFLIWEPR
jgi:hypothetical protein